MAKRKDETPEVAVALPTKKDLSSLMQQTAAYNNRAATAAGHAGELIREYAENKHVHKGAFRIIQRWERMKADPGKLWMELAHLDDYRRKLGVDKWAETQGQLVGAFEEKEGKEEESNVVRHPKAREVSETAGGDAA